MPEDVAKDLKAAIRHRIACVDRTIINGFAGTGRSRKRENECTHSIAKAIVCQGLTPFAFFWSHGNQEPAGQTDVYLTVFSALFDIDDEDARRWTRHRLCSDAEVHGDQAAHHHDDGRARIRWFRITRRRT
jgi:hypothetical protein